MVEVLYVKTLQMEVDRRKEGLTKEGFPRYQEKIIREGDISHFFWNNAQIGMIWNIIKPLYQEEDSQGRKLGKGEIRLIDLNIKEEPKQLI